MKDLRGEFEKGGRFGVMLDKLSANEAEELINHEISRNLDLKDAGERCNLWMQRAENWHTKWQEANDREIVMGEKIKRLKELAETCDRHEPCDFDLILDRINDL